MKSLIEILKKETESLKVQFIERMVIFATKEYEKAEERKNWDVYDYCKYLEVTPIIPKEKSYKYQAEIFILPKGFFRTDKGRLFKELKNKTNLTITTTKEKHIQNIIKNTELHYENSIKKLTNRLQKFNLNIDNLKAQTSHIGVNIETTLTDGIKTVRAFTIIADGEIQRPHYRYLIK